MVVKVEPTTLDICTSCVVRVEPTVTVDNTDAVEKIIAEPIRSDVSIDWDVMLEPTDTLDMINRLLLASVDVIMMGN